MPHVDTSLAAACHAFANSKNASNKFSSWSFTLFVAALIDCAVVLPVVFIILGVKHRKSLMRNMVKNVGTEGFGHVREVTNADAQPDSRFGVWKWMLSTLRADTRPKAVCEERLWTIPTSEGRNGRRALAEGGDLSLFDVNFTNSTWTSTDSRAAADSEHPSSSPSPPPPAYTRSEDAQGLI